VFAGVSDARLGAFHAFGGFARITSRAAGGRVRREGLLVTTASTAS
jgi:hypothetical protein